MGHDGYDGYQSYDSYEYDPYQQQQQQGGGVPEQYEGRQQYGQQYEQYEEQAQYAQPQYEQQYQPQPQYQDAQWAQSGLGWEQQAWDEARLGVAPLQELQEQGYAPYQEPQYPESQYPESQYPDAQYQQQYEQYEQYDESAASAEYGAPGLPHQRAAQHAAQHAGTAAEAEPSPATSASAAASASASASDPAVPNGRGAFGAAGIGVVAAISALAGSGALVVVIALIQAGIAYGWQQAVTLRENGRPDRRAAVLTALIGWAAAVSAFRLPVNVDFVGLPVTLGVGFLLLAADQTLRSRPLGDGQRVAGLDLTVTGGLFAVLPAGFVVAERSDTALTAACALAAALGVLCCALLGRNPLRGIVISFLLGAGIGAVAAQSLSAHGGLEAGALGGAVAALAAAAALGAVDRIAAEGGLRGSSRIVSQVLPSSLAAMGALFASAVFR